jgi:hypothetical protein
MQAFSLGLIIKSSFYIKVGILDLAAKIFRNRPPFLV